MSDFCVKCGVEFEDYCPRCGSAYGICSHDGACQGRIENECHDCEHSYSNIAGCPICGERDYLYDSHDPLDGGFSDRVGAERACAHCLGKETEGGFYISLRPLE